MIFLSCHHSDKKNVDKNDYYSLDIKTWNQERLDIDSMEINGHIPLITTTTNLVMLLGKPDTIISIYPNFSNSPKSDFKNEVLYFKDLRYVTSGENAYIQSINFQNSNLRVIHPKITLDSNTTIKDVQKKFPQAGRLIQGGGSTFDGFMQLRTSRDWGDVTLWFLIFKRTKLVRLDLLHAY